MDISTKHTHVALAVVAAVAEIEMELDRKMLYMSAWRVNCNQGLQTVAASGK